MDQDVFNDATLKVFELNKNKIEKMIWIHDFSSWFTIDFPIINYIASFGDYFYNMPETVEEWA